MGRKGKPKKEETIIASFRVRDWTAEFDGLCWMLNQDGVANKQLYYTTLEGACNAILNKVGSYSGKDLKDLIQVIKEAKDEIKNAIHVMEITR